MTGDPLQIDPLECLGLGIVRAERADNGFQRWGHVCDRRTSTQVEVKGTLLEHDERFLDRQPAKLGR